MLTDVDDDIYVWYMQYKCSSLINNDCWNMCVCLISLTCSGSLFSGMLGTNMAALSGMGMNVAAMGSNLLGLGGGMTSMGGSISGMMGGVSGLGSGLGGSSSGVGSGLGMMSSSGLGGGGGSSSGLGGSLSSPLGGLSSSLGMRGGLGENSYLSKGSGGSGLAGLGSSGLGGLSDNRMSSMSGGDLYGSLTSLGYDRGGNLDRIGSSFDRGLDRSDSYGKSSDNSTIFVKNVSSYTINFYLEFFVSNYKLVMLNKC